MSGMELCVICIFNSIDCSLNIVLAYIFSQCKYFGYDLSIGAKISYIAQIKSSTKPYHPLDFPPNNPLRPFGRPHSSSVITFKDQSSTYVCQLNHLALYNIKNFNSIYLQQCPCVVDRLNDTTMHPCKD